MGINAAGKPKYKITGVHSDNAFVDGTVRIKPGTDIERLGNGYYKAKIERKIPGLESNVGWKVKTEKSTFFLITGVEKEYKKRYRLLF